MENTKSPSTANKGPQEERQPPNKKPRQETPNYDMRLKTAEKMRENTVRMNKELQLQIDFLDNNSNVILESIRPHPELEALEIPLDNHRNTVNGILKARIIIQSEYESAKTVENMLINWQEDTESVEQRTNYLTRNIKNLRRNFLSIKESLDNKTRNY